MPERFEGGVGERGADQETPEALYRAAALQFESNAKGLAEDVKSVDVHAMKSLDPKRKTAQARLMIAAGAALAASPMIANAVAPEKMQKLYDAASAAMPQMSDKTVLEIILASSTVFAAWVGSEVFKEEKAKKLKPKNPYETK